MQVIDHIFKALGGATAIATATGAPVQTVHSWKTKNCIPPWRRSSVLRAPLKEGERLSPEAVEYLRSAERKPQIATAA